MRRAATATTVSDGVDAPSTPRVTPFPVVRRAATVGRATTATRTSMSVLTCLTSAALTPSVSTSSAHTRVAVTSGTDASATNANVRDELTVCLSWFDEV